MDTRGMFHYGNKHHLHSNWPTTNNKNPAANWTANVCEEKPIQYHILSINWFFYNTVTWEKIKWSNSKTESLHSQGSELSSELHSMTVRKSLKKDTLVSLPLLGTLNNSLCVHLLSLILWSDCKLLKVNTDFFIFISFIPGSERTHISSVPQ